MSSHAATSAQSAMNPLSPTALLNKMLLVLGEPQSSQDSQDRSRIVLKSPSDAILALLHAAMLNLGFRFLGLGESGSAMPAENEGILPGAWNSTGDSYSFRYKHAQSSMTFVLKALQLGKELAIHGMALEDGHLHSFTTSFSSISPSFNFSYSVSNQTRPNQTSPQTQTFSFIPLAAVFSSEKELEDLMRTFKSHVIQKLIPGLDKEGYEETRTTPAPPSSASTAYGIPRFPAPHYPYQRTRNDVSGFTPYTTIGDADLDPLAASPGMRPPNFGGAYHGGTGMFVGPDHPMFIGGGVPRPGGFDPLYGGPVRFPPGAVPEGARFDPVTPFGPRPGFRPNFGGAGGVRLPRGRGESAGGMPFSGDPDNDELPPPGYNDMFM